MEALGRKAEGILKDLALNSKSKRVQNRCRIILKKRGISYEEETANDSPEPVPLESPHRPGSNLFNLLKLPNVPALKPASPNPAS